ncbi:MAG: hypothetical protein ACWA5P_02855 [bacterium]
MEIQRLRKLTKDQFDETNIANTPMNWHVWKRAFELGYRLAEQKQPTI